LKSHNLGTPRRDIFVPPAYFFGGEKLPPDFILTDEGAANEVGAGCRRREIYENKGNPGENKYLMLASLIKVSSDSRGKELKGVRGAEVRECDETVQ
jgi:hypothetical protein